MEPFETFTWYDVKRTKEIGQIRKGLQLLGWLFAGAMIVYIIVTAFEAIV